MQQTAKIALTPQFIAQSYQMPAHVQNALQKFIKHFPRDTQAATWHVEPISTFRDPHLRTARANQQYRIILRIPFDGDDTWYLLWVDNHDEAMDWAKNKRVDWNRQVQAVQVYDVSVAEIVAEAEKVQDHHEQHPLDQVSDAQLIQIGVPDVLIPSIRKLDDFYAVDQVRTYLPESVYENLLHVFAGDPIEHLIRDVEEGRIDSDDFQEQKQSANNRRGIVELTDDEALNEALNGDFAAWRVFLHPTQRILAEGSFKGPVKVTGGAGTGKTVAALHRARYLSHHGEGKVLFTTFTKSLTSALEKDLRDLGTHMSRVKVTNLDKLLGDLYKRISRDRRRINILEFADKLPMAEGILDSLCQKTGLTRPFTGKELLNEYTNVVLAYNCQSLSDYQNVQRIGRGFRLGSNQRQAVWEVLQAYEQQLNRSGYRHLGQMYNEVANFLRQHPNKRPYRHVVADEIQDLGLIKLRFLRALAPETNDDLFLVGDPLQKIYPGQTNFSKVGIHIRGKRSRKLKINYRTTEEIRRFAMVPVLPIELQDFDGEAADKKTYISLRAGKRPEYQLHPDQATEIEQVIAKIRQYLDPEYEEHVAASEIALACPKKRNLDEVIRQLHPAEIPYYLSAGKYSKGDRRGLVLSSIHNLKGHEYKVVFLLHIDAGNYPMRPTGYQNWAPEQQETYDRQQAALLYVASSRAINRLHVSGVGQPSPFLTGLEE